MITSTPPKPPVSKTDLLISGREDQQEQRFNDYLYVDRRRDNPKVFRSINSIFDLLQRFGRELSEMNESIDKVWRGYKCTYSTVVISCFWSEAMTVDGSRTKSGRGA